MLRGRRRRQGRRPPSAPPSPSQRGGLRVACAVFLKLKSADDDVGRKSGMKKVREKKNNKQGNFLDFILNLSSVSWVGLIGGGKGVALQTSLTNNEVR